MSILRLDDEVDVICLDRELGEAHAETFMGDVNALRQHAHGLSGT